MRFLGKVQLQRNTLILGIYKVNPLAMSGARRSSRLSKAQLVPGDATTPQRKRRHPTESKDRVCPEDVIQIPTQKLAKRARKTKVKDLEGGSGVSTARDVPPSVDAQVMPIPETDVLDVVKDETSSPTAVKKSPVKTPRKSRAAAPNTTNAPLQTPGGSRLLRLPSLTSSSAPAPRANGLALNEASNPALTTENLLETAKAHLLSIDPKLATVISQNHCKMFDPEGLAEEIEPFNSLASGIMGQQVSGAAAAAIKKKFVGLFFPPDPPANSSDPNANHRNSKRFPSPEQVVAMDIATLRTAGLSQRKAEYIHGLAEKFASGELSAQMLLVASDEEVLEKLIAVRGLGRWSVEMFATFGLKRMDIFSTGDLGVQRGMAAYVGRDVAKLKNKGGKWKYMSEEEMLRIASQFIPYRSLFMWYMWRIEDVKTEVLGG